jgi:hypothetical protein
MCKMPNICLLKSCRGHDLMIGFNRRIVCSIIHENTVNNIESLHSNDQQIYSI